MAVDPIVAYGPSLARAVDAVARDALARRASGVFAETWDRRAGSNTSIMIDGTAYFVLIGLVAGDVVTNLSVLVTTPGVTMSLSKVGLYSTAGTRLAVSADQGTAMETVGIKTIALGSPYVVTASGAYYVAIVAKAAVLPTVTRGGVAATSSGSLCGGIGGGSMMHGVQTGQTDLVASATIAAGSSFAYWFGAS